MHYKKYNTMEKWKKIKGLEGFYEISSLGNVRSVERVVNGRKYKGCNIKPLIGYGGYYSVQLRKNVKKSIFYVHRLVAEHFIDKIDGKNIINHIDENKLNNNVENLEWCTNSENAIHSNKKAGFLSRKFTNEEILKIRQRHNNGETIYSITKDLNENGGTISNIVNYKTYKNI